MAARMPEVESVVTVAGNLDTEAWAEPRGVSLGASLNPATVPRREDLRELHLAGGRDNVVPAELVRKAVAPRRGAEFRLFPDFDHGCCWGTVWPEVLKWVDGAR